MTGRGRRVEDSCAAVMGTAGAGAPVTAGPVAQAAISTVLLLGDWLTTVSVEALQAGRRPVDARCEVEVAASTPVDLGHVG
jgi:hypothetical protein